MKKLGGIDLTFPVYIPLGPLRIHPHFIFETLAYIVGFRLYLYLRRHSGDKVAEGNRMWAVVGAALGAAVGAKVLYWLELPVLTWEHRFDLAYLMGGKSVVGALLGGLVGVEWVKKRIGETKSTGDLFVIPLCIGMAIGRIGCFLTGLDDHTHGIATALPWGIDYGDGIFRHPTQLYEILFLLGMAAWARFKGRQLPISGDLFKGFMILYLTFRLGVEFIKPDPGVYLGLTGIQVACLAGLIYYRNDIRRLFKTMGGVYSGRSH